MARRFLAVPEDQQRALFRSIPEPDVRVWDWEGDPETAGIATIVFVPRLVAPPEDVEDVERRLLLGRHDRATRAVYADWLDGQGRTDEASYVRLHEALRDVDERDLAPVDRALAQLRALQPATALWWRQAIAVTKISEIEDACYALGGARLRYSSQAWIDPARVPGALEAVEEWRLSELAREHGAVDPMIFDHHVRWAIRVLRGEDSLRVVENHGHVLRDPHVIESPIGPAEVAYTISDAWHDTIMLARTREHFAMFSHFTTA